MEGRRLDGLFKDASKIAPLTTSTTMHTRHHSMPFEACVFDEIDDQGHSEPSTYQPLFYNRTDINPTNLSEQSSYGIRLSESIDITFFLDLCMAKEVLPFDGRIQSHLG